MSQPTFSNLVLGGTQGIGQVFSSPASVFQRGSVDVDEDTVTITLEDGGKITVCPEGVKLTGIRCSIHIAAEEESKKRKKCDQEEEE